MIPHIETSRIEILYKETMSRVESKDQKEQKKSYRLLEELCRGPSPAVRTFLTGALPELRSNLLSSLSATSPSSQVETWKKISSFNIYFLRLPDSAASPQFFASWRSHRKNLHLRSSLKQCSASERSMAKREAQLSPSWWRWARRCRGGTPRRTPTT